MVWCEFFRCALLQQDFYSLRTRSWRSVGIFITFVCCSAIIQTALYCVHFKFRLQFHIGMDVFFQSRLRNILLLSGFLIVILLRKKFYGKFHLEKFYLAFQPKTWNTFTKSVLFYTLNYNWNICDGMDGGIFRNRYTQCVTNTSPIREFLPCCHRN